MLLRVWVWANWFVRLFFFFIKIELEAAMGDADWEAETIRSSLYSHVPVFEPESWEIFCWAFFIWLYIYINTFVRQKAAYPFWTSILRLSFKWMPILSLLENLHLFPALERELFPRSARTSWGPPLQGHPHSLDRRGLARWNARCDGAGTPFAHSLEQDQLRSIWRTQTF